MKHFVCVVAIFGVLFFLQSKPINAGPKASLFQEESTRVRRAATEYILSEKQKSLIVDKHNELRRIVNPSAANMLYMSWHNGLEKLATEYSRKCIFAHNPARKLKGFPYVGENLHISSGTKITDEYGANAVASWDKEKEHYKYASGSCVQGEVCGHYTQTAWAKSYKVGCGVTMCDEVSVFGAIWKDVVIFACNYAPGGNGGGKIYASGIPCSKCLEGDVCIDKLCTNATRDTSDSARTAETSKIWQYFFVSGLNLFVVFHNVFLL